VVYCHRFYQANLEEVGDHRRPLHFLHRLGIGYDFVISDGFMGRL